MGKQLKLIAAVLLIPLILLLSACSDPDYIEIYTPTTEPPLFESVAIEGSVTLPGIYPLKTGDTIENLLQAAGGITQESSLKLIVSQDMDSPQKVNLNTAENWLLTALPGVGEARAADIINYRETHGSFVNIMELMKVPGFGQATFESLKNLVTVSGQ